MLQRLKLLRPICSKWQATNSYQVIILWHFIFYRTNVTSPETMIIEYMSQEIFSFNGVGAGVWGFILLGSTHYHLIQFIVFLQISKNVIIRFHLTKLPSHFSSTFQRFYPGDYNDVLDSLKIVSFTFTYNNWIYSQSMQLMPIKMGFKSELGNPTLIESYWLQFCFLE